VILLTSSQALTALARRMLLGEGSPSCGDSTSGRRPLYVRRCTAGSRACVHPCVRDCPSARKSRHGYHPAEVRFCWSVLFSAFLLLSTHLAAALSGTVGAFVRVDADPWAVLISQVSRNGAEVCGGAILASAYVFPAALCVYDASGPQASVRDLFVRAGISNA